MKITPSLLLFFPLLVVLGCSNPADNVPEAGVREASTNGTATVAEAADSPAGAAQTFSFGPANSTIAWVGSKVTGSHQGGFRNFAGEFRVVEGRLAATGNKVVIDTTSIWSDTDRLTGHLKSADFFDVAKYPTATFVSIAVDQTKSPPMVTGNLTLHGVTKEISFPATITVRDDEVAVSAEFFINRFDFEMKFPGKADDLIRKEVVLKLNVKAEPGRADFNSMPSATAAAGAVESRRASI